MKFYMLITVWLKRLTDNNEENENVKGLYIPQPRESAFLDSLLLQVYPLNQEYECKH